MLNVIYVLSIMLSVANKPIKLSVVRLNVVMMSVILISVVAPFPSQSNVCE
jgi:hypothetical protein